MGTFIQSFSVDGEVYELYANTDGEPGYQLLDYSGRSLTAATLVDVPDEATVTALVIAWCDGGARPAYQLR